MDPDTTATTLGELRASGYPDRSVKEELRTNLLARLGGGEPLFPSIVGFDDSVLPALERGILAMNELPDLPERIQVALFNILEERDVQIRGYQVRLPLDLLLVATANPEDYTHRGRIVSPLKDRFGTQVRTHYPDTMGDEIRIMDQEAR